MARSIQPDTGSEKETKKIRAGLIVTCPSTERAWVFSRLLANLFQPKRKRNVITHAGMGEILLHWGAGQSSPLGAELRKASALEDESGKPISDDLIQRTLRAWCDEVGKNPQEVVLLVAPPRLAEGVLTEFCHQAKTIMVDHQPNSLSAAIRNTLMEMDDCGGPVNPNLVKTALGRLDENGNPIHGVIHEIEKSMSPATPA